MRNKIFLSNQKNISAQKRTKNSGFFSMSFILILLAIFTWQCRVLIPVKTPAIVIPIAESDVKLITRAPLTVPVKRTINEAFPLRNYIFFEERSSEIPKRYVKLNKNQALKFELEHLRVTDIKNQTGRSERQMTVYYNILNILGYRMQQNPTTLITLIGASAGNGAALGKEYAESVKHYLVDIFGVKGTRIITEGKDRPINPSETPGGVNFLPLLRAGDRRVDIVSNSVDLMTPLQIVAVQADPLDSRVVFSAKSEKLLPLKSWNVELTDENGISQTFGPYTREQESVSGNTILGNRPEGKFKVVMSGTTEDGTKIRKESTLRLVRNPKLKEEALRYSILFDFDQSKAVATYEKFLTEVVAPQITNNSTVIIHGHTDIIGSAEYNMNLSQQRAKDVMDILQKATYEAGNTGIVYDVFAFGMDTENAPFGNKLPEERFYNRTVIIDIVRAK
ncbi:MAG: OmpA family protein [Paludibacter sp.]|nr:OmpA family protein [Paludibacter sp.]